MRRTRLVVVAMLVACGTACEPAAVDHGVTAPDGVPATLLAAGDIAECDGDARDTADLVAGHEGVVAPLGDLAYPVGSPENFTECYDPSWGEFRSRTRPALGNHDVMTDGAGGYFGYFGALAGPRPEGYYSYDLGEWHVVVLNSNCRFVGGCGADSAQVAWLRDDLADADTDNLLAYFHHPRVSTGAHGDTMAVDPMWDVLVEAGADVVVSAHDHDYQRFVPLDASEQPDPDGVRQFVVGTGGADLRAFGSDSPHVEFRQREHHGILRLDLEDCGYRWVFLAVGSQQPLDEGRTQGTC